jgi:hypothetical protein
MGDQVQVLYFGERGAMYWVSRLARRKLAKSNPLLLVKVKQEVLP